MRYSSSDTTSRDTALPRAGATWGCSADPPPPGIMDGGPADEGPFHAITQVRLRPRDEGDVCQRQLCEHGEIGIAQIKNEQALGLQHRQNLPSQKTLIMGVGVGFIPDLVGNREARSNNAVIRPANGCCGRSWSNPILRINASSVDPSTACTALYRSAAQASSADNGRLRFIQRSRIFGRISINTFRNISEGKLVRRCDSPVG